MAETFKKIIDNPREYSEIAERGRIRIAGSFSWNTISRDYVKLVKRALVNRGASR
jgi:glycosyltransferase involved in cell wall biosynthesis